VDYRHSISDYNQQYLCARIDDLLDRMQGAEVFSSFDPLSAHH
jgi:hypothetical protein